MIILTSAVYMNLILGMLRCGGVLFAFLNMGYWSARWSTNTGHKQSYEGFYSQKLHRNQQANTDGALKALSSMRTSLAVIWIFSLATVTDSSQSFQPLAAAPAGSAHTVGDMYRHSLTPASARTKHTADQQADYELKKILPSHQILFTKVINIKSVI